MTMPDTSIASRLDDAAVLRVLSHLTAEIREQIPSEAQTSITSAEEARMAVAALLTEEGVAPATSPDQILPEPAATPTQARALLQVFWEDEDLRPHLEELISHPPDDSQRSVELAMTSAVILGAVITWLQTKIDLKVTRKDGKTDFHFALRKNATDPALISDIAKRIGSILTGQ